MDYILDVIFGLLLAIIKQVKPDSKLKKWQEAVITVLSVLMLLCSLGCFIAGVHLLTSGYAQAAGKVLLSVGTVLVVAHCVAYAILIGKHFRTEAEKTDNCDDKN